MKMQQSSIEAFLKLVQTGLWGDTNHSLVFNIKESTNWGEIFQLAEEQSVVGLVAAGLDWLKINDSHFKCPQEVALQFIGATLQIEQQNKAMNAFVAKLIKTLREAGVYTLLVKGQGVAQCYEKPLWRACGDVDLFLSEDNYAKAKDVLLPMASDVEQEYMDAKHMGMTIDGWVVELHGSLHVSLTKGINRELDEIREDTFYGGNVRSWNNNGTQVFMLGVENDIFYVFVHFLNHFYKGGIGLRQICDWCRLMWTYREKIDWKKLETRIRKAGLMSEWKAFYVLATKYLGLPEEVSGFKFQDPSGSRWEKKADKIMDFILMSGNFGHNRDMSYYSKYPFVIRKVCSMWMRVNDLFNHARIFPMDSLLFSFSIMKNGLKSAMRGEG